MTNSVVGTFSPSSVAIRNAWALAGAHGHSWAQGSYEGERELEREGAWRVISEGLAARGWPSPETHTSAAAPTTWEEACADYRLEECRSEGISGLPPSLRHVTGSGRLSWDVDPVTGDVLLEVSRPNGTVLRAQTRGAAVSVEVLKGYYLRHVEVLASALSVLGIPVPVELYAGVEETPDQLEGWAREAETVPEGATSYSIPFRANRARFLRAVSAARGPSARRPFPRGLTATEARRMAAEERTAALWQLRTLVA